MFAFILRRAGAAAGAAFLLCQPGFAQEQPDDLAARFGAMPSATGMRLSPDGTHVSFIDRSRGFEGLKVANVDTGEIIPVIRAEGEMRLSSCQWLNNERLGCNITGSSQVGTYLVSYQRFLAINMDGSDVRQLGQRATSRHTGLNQFSGLMIDVLPDDPDHVLMEVDQLRSTRAGSLIGSEEEGPTVQRVNIHTNRMAKVLGPIDRAEFFATDGSGDVRLFGKYEGHSDQLYSNNLRYYVRQPGEHGFDRLAETRVATPEQMTFEGFDETGTMVYFRAPHNGHQAMFKVPTSGRGDAELVWSNENFDAGELVTFGPKRRPVGVSWSDEGSHIDYFDPQLDSLQDALDAALGDDLSATLLEQSYDGNRILLVAASDRNPGTYYLFDRSSGELRPLMDIRPWLQDVELSARTPISYTAADGTQIPAYLSLPPGKTMGSDPMPLLVMPHGGPSARDYWGFDWLAQSMAAHGFAVIQPNYRGSSGYGAEWSGQNAYRDWEIAIGDISDAARWAVSEGLTTTGQTAIFGWSYGGYAALQASAVNPKLFQAVVAVAPVTDLEQKKSDAVGFMNADIVANMIGTGPHVQAGSPQQQAARIEAPVLLFHGTKDTNVLVGHSRKMADRLEDLGKRVEYVEFDDLDHFLAMTEARAELLEKSIAFLKQETAGN